MATIAWNVRSEKWFSWLPAEQLMGREIENVVLYRPKLMLLHSEKYGCPRMKLIGIADGEPVFEWPTYKQRTELVFRGGEFVLPQMTFKAFAYVNHLAIFDGRAFLLGEI